jgi:hypothetical protein
LILAGGNRFGLQDFTDVADPFLGEMMILARSRLKLDAYVSRKSTLRRDTPQPAAAWRCEPQWDVAAISQRYVAAWCASGAVSEEIAQR